jgi:hypothetical protein
VIPESYIIGSIGSLWIERFPDHHTVNFPKGLVKRISMAPIKNKSGIVSGQYATRISIQWYDEDSTAFDMKMRYTQWLMKGERIYRIQLQKWK